MLILLISSVVSNVLPTNCVTNGTVCLTIDEGPSVYTSQILDTLEKENVKASFHFNTTVRGSEFQDVYQRAIDDGHDIGFRTAPNRKYSDDDDYEEVEEDIDQQVRHLESQTDQKVKFARSPLNGALPINNVYKYFQSKGIIQTSYSFCPYDDQGTDPEEQLKDFLSPSYYKQDSFIIQLYDQRLGEDDNLSEMIKIIKEKNYTIVPLSECLDGYTPGKALQNRGKARKSRARRLNMSHSLLPFLLYFLV